ncbi:MAG: proton-conducting transporter membrane subunit [Candidatus Odinarchaeota archaeon]
MVAEIILAVCPLILPLLAALVGYLLSLISDNARNAGIIFVISTAFIINSILLIQANLGAFTIVELGALIINESGIFVSELVLFLSLLVIVYSIRYMSAERDKTLYYVLICIFTGTMNGLIFSFNIIILYMFIEASTVTSAILVMFGRTRRANRAAIIYLAISILGGFFILGAEFVLVSASGVELLTDPAIALVSADIRLIISVLMLVGFGVKAGIIPFGFIWLPRAHAEAPSPISALLSGVLVQVAAFAMIRTIGVVAFDIQAVSLLLIVFGVGSMLSGSLSALFEVYGVKLAKYRFNRDIKRVLAYSTISEIGFIIMLGGIQGLFGPFAPPVEFSALTAMLLHLYNHGFSKALLFLAVGVIMYYLHIRDIGQMGGLSKSMPITTTSFLIGALSLGMIPPLFGYKTIFELAFEIPLPLTVNIFLIVSIITIGLTLAFYISAFTFIFIKPRPKGALGDISVDAAKVTPPPRVKLYQPLPMIFPVVFILLVVIALGILFLSGILTASTLNLEHIAFTVINPGL